MLKTVAKFAWKHIRKQDTDTVLAYIAKRSCLIIAILTIVAFGFYIYYTSTAKHYHSPHLLNKIEDRVYTRMKASVQSCDTPNCFGIGAKHNKGLRFMKIFCKTLKTNPQTNKKELSLIDNLTEKQGFYSKTKRYDLQGEKNILDLLKKGILKHNQAFVVVPIIKPIDPYNPEGGCNYDMHLLTQHQNKEGTVYKNTSLFIDKNTQIPFFMEKVFPNLNTKCNPHYDPNYAPTDFEYIIAVPSAPYFIWFSIEDHKRCNTEVGKNEKSIINTVQEINQEVLSIYETTPHLTNIFNLLYDAGSRLLNE